MLIIGLNGSPDKKGNTVRLLEEALKAAQEQGAKTELIHAMDVLKDCKTPFCVVCSNPCSGICYQETGVEKLFDLFKKADGILLGSPVYFGTVSAQLKAIWDKTRKLRGEKVLLNVVGGAITVGASRFGGQETTMKAMIDMMMVQGMLIIGDGDKDFDCGHQGAGAQRPAEDDQFGLKRAYIMGKRITEVAEATKKIRIR